MKNSVYKIKPFDIPMSKYGQYHLKYLGFNFKSIATGKIYSKGDFWDCYRKLAESLPVNNLMETPICPSGFFLVDFPHIWNEPNDKITISMLKCTYKVLIELRKNKRHDV